MTQVIGNPKWYELNDEIKETKQALQLAFSSFMDGEPCSVSPHEMYNMMSTIKNLRYRRAYMQRYTLVEDNDSRLQHDGGVPSGESKFHVPSVPTDASPSSDGYIGGQSMMELEGINTDGLWRTVDPAKADDGTAIVGVKCGRWQHYRCYYQSENGGGSMVLAARSVEEAVHHLNVAYGYEVRMVESL